MTKATTTEAQPDILPAPDDDIETLPIQEAAPSAATEGEPEALTPAEDPDPRAEITRRYREKRNAENAPAATAAAAPAGEGEGGEAPADGDGDPPEPALTSRAKPASPTPAENPQTITLIVDGKPVEKSLEEVTKLAQITVAADNRLDEAKRLLTEAKAIRPAAEHPPQPAEATARPDPSKAPTPPEHQRPAIDKAKLANVVERIQVGSAEDGVAAFEELFESLNAARPQDTPLSREDVNQLVAQHLTQRATQQDIDSALTSFAKEFPDIAKDDDFRGVGLAKLEHELVTDLKAVGLTDADLAPMRGNPLGLSALHNNAKVGGLAVRSYGDVLTKVGNDVRTKFNLAPPQPEPRPAPGSRQIQRPPSSTAQAREAAKRAAPQQPRTAGARVPTPQPPRPKSPREIVEQARKARGFAPTA